MQGSRRLTVRLAALTVLMVLMVLGLPEALAVLPTPVAPSTSPASGDWLGLIQGYAKDAGIVLTLAFTWSAWVAYGAYRAWGEGAIAFYDLIWALIRASALLMVLGFYLR
jgi:integrating conjugative element protein (TIGR03758 family)